MASPHDFLAEQSLLLQCTVQHRTLRVFLPSRSHSLHLLTHQQCLPTTKHDATLLSSDLSATTKDASGEENKHRWW